MSQVMVILPLGQNPQVLFQELFCEKVPAEAAVLGHQAPVPFDFRWQYFVRHDVCEVAAVWIPGLSGLSARRRCCELGLVQPSDWVRRQ
eukprot:273147-Chlamydomonas_euryale.AAC.1